MAIEEIVFGRAIFIQAIEASQANDVTGPLRLYRLQAEPGAKPGVRRRRQVSAHVAAPRSPVRGMVGKNNEGSGTRSPIRTHDFTLDAAPFGGGEMTDVGGRPSKTVPRARDGLSMREAAARRPHPRSNARITRAVSLLSPRHRCLRHRAIAGRPASTIRCQVPVSFQRARFTTNDAARSRPAALQGRPAHRNGLEADRATTR